MFELSQLILPGFCMLSLLIGVLIGHFLTMKAFSHVQPSTKDMAKDLKRSVTTEPDPWAYNETAGEKKEKDDSLERMFEETGLPREQFDPKSFFGYDTVNKEKE